MSYDDKGWGTMKTVLDRMASQAEREGVTLAEIVARDMPSGEMDRAQEFLHRELAENYAAIEEFMNDVEVTGTFDFSSMSEDELDECQENLLKGLSDTPLVSEMSA